MLSLLTHQNLLYAPRGGPTLLHQVCATGTCGCSQLFSIIPQRLSESRWVNVITVCSLLTEAHLVLTSPSLFDSHSSTAHAPFQTLFTFWFFSCSFQTLSFLSFLYCFFHFWTSVLNAVLCFLYAVYWGGHYQHPKSYSLVLHLSLTASQPLLILFITRPLVMFSFICSCFMTNKQKKKFLPYVSLTIKIESLREHS